MRCSFCGCSGLYMTPSCWQTHWRDSPCWPDEVISPTGSPTCQETRHVCWELVHHQELRVACFHAAGSPDPRSYCKEMHPANNLHQFGNVFPSQTFRWNHPLFVCNQGRLWGKDPIKGLPTNRKCEIISGCYFQLLSLWWFFNAIIASSYTLFF